MTDKQQDILEKIRKLNAHAESAAQIGNEAEAQAFAAKVQELLTAYKLSAADIGGRPVAEEPIDYQYVTWQDMGLKEKKVRVGWAERLAALCAKAYYCEFIISTGNGRIGMLVGAKTERDMCVFMFITLGRFLHKLADREMDAYWKRVVTDAGLKGLPPGCNNFKAGFISGFLERLRERFDEELATKSDAASQSQVSAIVLVRKNTLARVDAWVGDNLSIRSIRSAHMSYGSRDGRDAGRAAANSLNLKPNVAGAAPGRNQLR